MIWQHGFTHRKAKQLSTEFVPRENTFLLRCFFFFIGASNQMKLKLRIDMNVSTPFPKGLYRGRLQVSDFIIMLAFILEERYTCAEHLNQATTTTTAEKHTLWHGAKSWHKKSVKNWLPFAQQSMCSTYGHYIYSSSPSISCAFAIVRKTGTQLILSFAIEVYTLLSSLSTSRNNRFSMHTAMCSLDRERTLRVP